MHNQDEHILLIESDHKTAALVCSALANTRNGNFIVEWVSTLQAGLERLSTGGIQSILLNLFLSDSRGIETFNKLYEINSHVAILILSNHGHEHIATLSIQKGAQDYLLTEHINSYSLSRAIGNIMARKTAEEILFIEKERAQVTLNSIGDAVISTDINGNITFLNTVAEHMTGWSHTEAKGQRFGDVFRVINSVTRETLPNPMDLAIHDKKSVSLAAGSILIRRNGTESPIEDSASPIRDSSGRIIGAVIVFHDVSEAHSMVLKMAHLAQHDFLTNLPNRLLLNDRLTQDRKSVV